MESLDVRRSIAAGELARQDLALDLDIADPETGEITRTVPGRTTELILHVSAADQTVGRLGNTRTPISPEQVKTWINTPGSTVIIRPVLDLNSHQPVDSYEIPDRIRRQVTLRDHHCVFPHCTKPAERCDLDHVVPYAEGGETSARNLVPDCRGHHRFKTSGQMTCRILTPRHLPVDQRQRPAMAGRPHRHPRPLTTTPRHPASAGPTACSRVVSRLRATRPRRRA